VSTTAIPAVIDYLVAQANASASLGASASAPVAVYDGPVVLDQWPPMILWVGVDAQWLLQDQQGTTTPAKATQEWVGPGNRKRNEHLTISCVADAWYGGTDVRTARQSVLAIMAAFEDMTRNDANLGGNVLFIEPGVTNTQWYAGQFAAGLRVLAGFDFNCFARIGT